MYFSYLKLTKEKVSNIKNEGDVIEQIFKELPDH